MATLLGVVLFVGTVGVAGVHRRPRSPVVPASSRVRGVIPNYTCERNNWNTYPLCVLYRQLSRITM